MKNGNIKLVVTEGAPSRLLQEHSPARMQLAKLINDRLSIESKVRHRDEAAQALARAAAAEGQATAALANFEAQETAAMSEWSKSPSSPMPISNPARRDELLAAIRAASAQAQSARKAAQANDAEKLREIVKLKQIEDAIDVAVSLVVVDEVEPLMAEFTEMNHALAAKAGKISEASEVVNLIAAKLGKLASDRPNPEAARPVFVALEKLNERIRLAFARPMPEVGKNHRAPWDALATRLRSDPIAELDA